MSTPSQQEIQAVSDEFWNQCGYGKNDSRCEAHTYAGRMATEILRLRGINAEAIAILRENEWEGVDCDKAGDSYASCISCGFATDQGHDPDCRLKALFELIGYETK